MLPFSANLDTADKPRQWKIVAEPVRRMPWIGHSKKRSAKNGNPVLITEGPGILALYLLHTSPTSALNLNTILRVTENDFMQICTVC